MCPSPCLLVPIGAPSSVPQYQSPLLYPVPSVPPASAPQYRNTPHSRHKKEKEERKKEEEKGRAPVCEQAST
eukprot:2424551-Rhodomonas_salina.3